MQDKALPEQSVAPARAAPSWKDRISAHIAYALLVYTGLQIFVTLGAIKAGGTSLLPYLALVVLVGAIIPACRLLELRWERLIARSFDGQDLSSAYRRDRSLLWLAALGLPLLLTGAIKLLSAFA